MSDWAIPQQAKLKYTQLFNLHDRSRSGFLSGLQCRDILLQSALPRNVLAEIWNLSDIDGDGQLTREEFILAMHLTNHVRSGHTLPTELPSELVPPSYRRSRSISTTSVHSATSATSTVSATNDEQAVPQKPSSDALASATATAAASSSFAAGSVLNSNSFEDKRRENFEKGRAELERRRLKIIEHQCGIIREQLGASKKQVAEAKSKIDALRTERDTKMGLITSLEAQLKTLQDRKAYLNHEELSLIAIAKDLNLVDPTAAQTELDQVATQAKQQSINQMKEKLGEFLKEKETKLKELEDVAKRLEESKKELKLISEKVSKTYENYKEKVANAKVMRQQFIDESKSQAANLDSVWDSSPSVGLGQANIRLESTTINNTNTANSDPWASDISKNSSEPFDFFTQVQSFNNNDDFQTSSVVSPKFADQSLEKNRFADHEISSESAQQRSVKRYRALYAFEARNPDELTINPGDIIIGSEQVCEPGWLSGESNGQFGLFPEAYVELIPDDDVEAIKSNDPIQTYQEATNSSSNQEPLNDLILHPSKTIQPVSPPSITYSGIKYKVVYAFDQRNPDELTINPGDIIVGLEGVHEPGWLTGELNGKRGLFPEDYVEKLPEQVIQEQQTEQPGKSRTKRAEVATVIANYRALGQEQLNLEKGQLVLIRRKMDSGWWEGEIQLKAEKTILGEGGRTNGLDHLIRELIESEMDFVNDLRLCRNAYILRLQSYTDVSSIFINWDKLIRLHDRLLVRLASNSLPGNYAIVFRAFEKLLKNSVHLYIEYCSQQNESMRRLESKLVSDIRFKQLVNECQRDLARQSNQQVATKMGDTINRKELNGESRPASIEVNLCAKRNSNLPLSSFMLKPIQRITKYSLLFERIAKIIAKDEQGLSELATKLKDLAQTICNQVNEACRIKEESEENRRRLDWVETHIESRLGEFAISDISSNHSLGSIESRRSPTKAHLSERSSSSIGNQFNFHPTSELSLLDSQAERRLIKAGSMLKWPSKKELILFLFNDLLLLTQVEGGSPLRVANVFNSLRAQRSYYKLYREPISASNILLHSNNLNYNADDHSDQDAKQSTSEQGSQAGRLSWSEQQLLMISFSDISTGFIYNLLALNLQEKTGWLCELEALAGDRH